MTNLALIETYRLCAGDEQCGNYTVYEDRGVASSFSTGMHLSAVCLEDVPFTREDEVHGATVGTFMGAELYRRYENACRM
jgi:hypothetical protein